MTTTAIGVLASAPLPGRCKQGLLAAHSPEWVAGLHAAMLRDTLDGLQAIEAAHHVVFAEDADADALASLARHVPAPWELVPLRSAERGARLEEAFAALLARGVASALLAASDAPSAPTDELAAATLDPALREGLVVSPSEDGSFLALGAARALPGVFADLPWETPAVLDALRLRCRERRIDLHALTPWYRVDAPSDVLRLIDELRKHPERAPRTAHFLVTSG